MRPRDCGPQQPLQAPRQKSLRPTGVATGLASQRQSWIISKVQERALQLARRFERRAGGINQARAAKRSSHLALGPREKPDPAIAMGGGSVPGRRAAKNGV